MLRGRTRIELFNEATGEVQCYESDNIVTAAVENYFNSVIPLLINTSLGSQFQNIKNMPKSVFETMFGGVLVFSESIQSNKDHIIPTWNEIKSFIGCGNQEASRTGDRFKGAFNGSESNVSETSATFVWDFTTEQCNGKIACICLTSNNGGETGFGTNLTALSEGSNRSFVPLGNNMFNMSQGVGSPARDQYYGVKYNSGNKTLVGVEETTCFMRTNSKAGTVEFGEADAVNVRLDKTLVNNFVTDLTVSDAAFYDIKTEVPCTDLSVLVAVNGYPGANTDILSLLKYNMAGDAEIIEINCANLKSQMQISGYYDSYTWGSTIFGVLYDNGLIITQSVQENDEIVVYKLSDSGSFEYKKSKLNGSGGNAPNWVAKIAGEWYLMCSQSNYCKALYHLDTESLEVSENAIYMLPAFPASNYSYAYTLEENDKMSAPWLGYSGYSGQGVMFDQPVLFAPYLATINNIQGDLIKDASKTMKIVYTLTKE